MNECVLSLDDSSRLQVYKRNRWSNESSILQWSTGRWRVGWRSF